MGYASIHDQIIYGRYLQMVILWEMLPLFIPVFVRDAAHAVAAALHATCFVVGRGEEL